MAPGKWDDDTDKRLMMAIIQTSTGGKAPDWTAISALMGEGFGVSAISQRYTKHIKKKPYAQFGDEEGQEGTAKKTPAKRGGRKANGETKTAGSKRKGSKVDSPVEDAESDEEKQPQSKKQKIKEEPAEEDDDDGLV